MRQNKKITKLHLRILVTREFILNSWDCSKNDPKAYASCYIHIFFCVAAAVQ
jgi:hypothetical protein